MKGLTKMGISIGIMVLGLTVCGVAFYNVPKTSSLFTPLYYSGCLIAIVSILPLLLGSVDSFFEKVDEVIEYNKKFDEEQTKLEQRQNQSGFPKEIV